MFSMWTWQQCITFCASDPDPENCGPVCDDPPACPGTRCRESLCRAGCLIGDYDADGDVDARDFCEFQECFSGSPGDAGFIPPTDECAILFDYDEDVDIDLQDYATYQSLCTGP